MRVYLDAGHNYSGIDTGAQGFGLREQDITYYIASRVQKILTGKGITVKMSRNNLTDNVTTGGTVSNSLAARYSAANSWKADIFVSIHCNAGGGTGFEVYHYNGSERAKTLAGNILNGLKYNTDLVSRGVKTETYAVLRNTTMPATLVETAFIDNEDNAKFLGSEDGQQKLAKGIAEGIMEYLGVDYSENSQQSNALDHFADVDKMVAELTTPNDIVWELAQRGLVEDKDGMLKEMNENPNGRLYWLARKVANR